MRSYGNILTDVVFHAKSVACMPNEHAQITYPPPNSSLRKYVLEKLKNHGKRYYCSYYYHNNIVVSCNMFTLTNTQIYTHTNSHI